MGKNFLFCNKYKNMILPPNISTCVVIFYIINMLIVFLRNDV